MDTSKNTTAPIFAAYLECPTKAYLTAHGEKPPDTFFADIRGRISDAYRAKAIQNLRMSSPGVAPIDFLRLIDDPIGNGSTLFVDCASAILPCEYQLPLRATRSEPRPEYVPILYSAWDKSDPSDELLICFGALAIGVTTRTGIPTSGKVIYGEAHRARTVRIADHFTKTRQIIEAITSLCHATEPPPLVLNKHCPTCDFQPRCRTLAVKRDSLSLLGAMTTKERAKCDENGVTTITQLSYGYRPRRRRHIKSTTPRHKPPIKNDHHLKALAIKKVQTHVVGCPSLSFEGTPVFMDVEGMLDRDFYYLIGLRYEVHGTPVEKTFWADGPKGEIDILRECLRILKEISNPRIVHYGAYEIRFLRRMRKRWNLTIEEAEFVDQIVDGSLNLLATIYGRIYFPTYSNDLKDIAHWLGFEWTAPRASGGASMLWRRCWELTLDDALRRELITYNIEDCRAAALVAEALVHICGNGGFHGATKLETVNVDSLDVSFHQTFGKFQSVIPGFEKINATAHWDYQRSKVYVRARRASRRNVDKTVKPVKKVIVNKEIHVERPESCPACGAAKLRVAENLTHVVFDLKFTRQGLKRWVIRYRYRRFRCPACRAQMMNHSAGSKYGPTLHSYVIYLLIEMRLSRQKIAEHVATVFNVPLFPAMVSDMKSTMARKYEPTYRQILEQIATGHHVHADETKGVVRGGGHYVWIFADPTAAAYVYSASREAAMLENVLKGFSGVLVSDFYAAYDAVPCQQQKCLIHLMRDINEDVVKHPFNEELTSVATRFGTLLRQIVDTIDRYGLKKRHLRKHKRSAERFLHDVETFQCTTQVVSSLKKRIRKNKDKLFTFLDYDNVPWNNNNAEHAVKAFTRLRNGMTISTPKGTIEYCILLTVQQTLRYRGMSFLDFLRSGKIAIETRVGRRKKGVIEPAPAMSMTTSRPILTNQKSLEYAKRSSAFD